MKHNILTIAGILLFTFGSMAQSPGYEISKGDLNVQLETGEGISFKVEYKGRPAIEQALISMEAGDQQPWGYDTNVKEKTESDGHGVVEFAVPNKDKTDEVSYRQLTLTFKTHELQLRVYDHAVAYRFVGHTDKEITVRNETLGLDFPQGTRSWFPKEQSFYSHYEQRFINQPVDSIPVGDFCALPVRFDVPDGPGILITEADLFDYPGLFLEKTASSFQGVFPKYVLETKPLESRPDRYEVITKEADYMARTSGERTFPWRVFMISDDDRDFVKSNLVMQLSRLGELKDRDWIKPGQVAWDWYNANNIYGVDFKSGINNATYKYYIDFAAQYGLEYIILDEGWSKTTADVLHAADEIDVPELVRYGSEKGVGIILWLLWHPLDKHTEEILQRYADWGVKGIKVDFMQRADQYMVNSYERIAREAAKRQLIVDFHGAFKPAGLRAAYPNVLTYEGVKGNENNKWEDLITPEHNVTLPFTRMVAGPMDYTPGAMANAQKKNFHISFERPMSLGTRCHQVAMYVVYESPLQMLCDAPSAYLKEKETTEFISRIPTVWDETIVLHGKIADYIAVARRRGDTWYIGAMTDWSPRTLELDLSFLDFGAYNMDIMKDGMNAERYAEDYQRKSAAVGKQTTIQMDMAAGGGWAAIVSPEED